MSKEDLASGCPRLFTMRATPEEAIADLLFTSPRSTSETMTSERKMKRELIPAADSQNEK